MSLFKLPLWINQHLFAGKSFSDLTTTELDNLKSRLKNFNHNSPDVSIMIPAWNEERNIFRTLSSLASNITDYKVQLCVINNNSTDNTQQILDQLGVENYFQPVQGTPHARELGLEVAKGKYHLCADSDTFYPPRWIELMTKSLLSEKDIVGVYGRYSFIPLDGKTRTGLFFYEKLTGILIRIRKARREHVNFLGFNMGFKTEIGRQTGGFKVNEIRKFDNAIDSHYYVEEAEDGRMAVNLKTQGKLRLVTHPAARVFTSSRRLSAEGGVVTSFISRVKLHTSRMSEYFSGASVE